MFVSRVSDLTCEKKAQDGRNIAEQRKLSEFFERTSNL